MKNDSTERATTPLPYRLGVDIGGTFTDIVLIGGRGDVFVKKVSSTTGEYARAILDGLAQLLVETGHSPSTIVEVIHGTTVATNAIVEQKGARAGLVTTLGFRDVLELGRLRLPDIYNIHYTKLPPLVERHLRLEVAERTGPDGQVVQPLDPASLEPSLARLAAEHVESVAVCLLHAYANPAHEQVIGRILRERLPACYVSLSSEVLPEIKEYERTSTTVINAYIQPVVAAYLTALAGGLTAAGLSGRLLIMQSNGGVMSARAAAARPIHIVESGPAAGVVAAASLARHLHLPNLLTLDMGGTTAKASVIEQGHIHRTMGCEVGAGITIGARFASGGYYLGASAIDVAEVGAGGGSLIWTDSGGSLKVGPASAGAVPGPVCYGQGNTQPTVTDANVVLGYLNPRYLVGGGLRLYPDQAHQALADRIAKPLGLDVLDAAFGAYLIANANMMRAVRAMSTERGRDPADFALCAFGGNGPVFAAGIARALGIRQVIVPPYPGLFSAFGLLLTDIAYDFVRTHLRRTQDLADDEVAGVFAGMETEALAALAGEGYAPTTVTLVRSADLRYVGQRYELTVPLDGGPLARAGDLLERAFCEEHERTYGYLPARQAMQLVNLRVTARAAVAGELPLTAPAPGTVERRPGDGRRLAYFGPDYGRLPTPVLGRLDLAGQGLAAGPLIVEDYDATTVVPPDCRARLGDGNVIVIEISARADE